MPPGSPVLKLNRSHTQPTRRPQRHTGTAKPIQSKKETFSLPSDPLRSAISAMTTLLFAFSFHGAPRSSATRAAVRLTTASTEPWQNLFVETDDGKGYVSSVLPAGPNASPDTPPLLLVPPIGVGITRTFFNRFMREWVEVGAPCEVHAPDLLGCGANWPRWPRKFYAPDDWAEQLDEYVRQNIARPVVVCTQGGLAPVALEIQSPALGTGALVSGDK